MGNSKTKVELAEKINQCSVEVGDEKTMGKEWVCEVHIH